MTDLDTGCGTHARIQPHSIPDGTSNRLAEGLGHALGDGASRETTRLQHQDPATFRPGFAQQLQGHAGALARARRGLEHEVVVCAQ